MESAFIEDYVGKIKFKPFKRDICEDYEGEYTFTVRIGVIDNTIEVKNTVTMCKLVEIAVDSHNSDLTYVAESEKEENSDSKTKRGQTYQELVSFDPEKQNTCYNNRPVPIDIEVIKVKETLSETATYTWITHYECIQTSSSFNKFLNTFKSGYSYPGIDKFEGLCYRFYALEQAPNPTQ